MLTRNPLAPPVARDDGLLSDGEEDRGTGAGMDGVEGRLAPGFGTELLITPLCHVDDACMPAPLLPLLLVRSLSSICSICRCCATMIDCCRFHSATCVACCCCK